MYVYLNHLGQCDMPDVALRVDGTVVEGEPVATTGVRQEDVAVSGRGGLAVLLQGDTAPAFVVAFLRWEASAGCDGGRPLDLITYCQSQTVIRSPVAVDPLHRQILMKNYSTYITRHFVSFGYLNHLQAHHIITLMPLRKKMNTKQEIYFLT